MAVDPKDAQALQAQGAVPETDSAGNPISYGSNANTVNAMFPNLPEGSKVVADNGSPGVISQLVGANPLGQILGAGKDAVGAIHNGLLGNVDVNQNGVQTKFDSNPAIQQDRENSRLSLTPSGEAAQQAAGEIAGIEGPLASKAGDTLKQTGQNLTDQGSLDSATASVEKDKGFQQSNTALMQAETDLQASAQKAAIHPNQYLENMGVGQRTMTAIGLLISGAGSGLTGQPNMANEMLQKNIDRDIAAQKQNYLNAYNQFLGSKAASQTALERANAATAAQNMATLTVNTGAGVMLNGLQTQVSGLTAKQRAEILKNQILQSTVAAKQAIDNQYIGAASNNDTATVNMYGNMAKFASGKLNPTKGMDRFSLSPRNQATDLNRLPNAEPEQPQETPIQEVPEAPKEEAKTPGRFESFLDRFAKFGKN